ncbi:Stage II sporulation protein E (SpoIIE) [Streptomyces sp. Cmuel-A718b]|nr:Stage II sporulation protein E (SpoIIE) [Streptomyces sp. Cmuel-A718b]
MGTDLGVPAIPCREQLVPGNRIVLHTDGVTEARDADGHEFGLERFTDFLDRHHADGLPVPETLRRLNPPVPDRLALRRARRRGRRRDIAYVARGSLPSSVT